MRKLFTLLILLFFFLAGRGQRAWDRPMQLKYCSIQVRADLFTATSTLDMEFYNPNDQEIEGLYSFQLNAGQVITDFKLELNGKYRDGSIEEKWKARNAYNTIVGKRVDPALLQMDYYNHYSLRIYPLAPKSTRKISMTIEQLMQAANGSLHYSMPLAIQDTVSRFVTKIEVSGSHASPRTGAGVLETSSFVSAAEGYELQLESKHMVLNWPLSFSIPFAENAVCTKQVDGKNYFAVRYHSIIGSNYSIDPKEIRVYWDVSRSSGARDTKKEINFLSRFIAQHGIRKVVVVPFNYRQQNAKSFEGEGLKALPSFLRSLNYDGGTQLGCIDLSEVRTEAVFIFTDGYNSYGKAMPAAGSAHVFCVHASSSLNRNVLQQLTGQSGGSDIDLLNLSEADALNMAGRAKNLLLSMGSISGQSIIASVQTDSTTKLVLVAGWSEGKSDSLYFNYGNLHSHPLTEKMGIGSHTVCGVSGIDRMALLMSFDSMIKNSEWKKLVLFGKEHRLVTPNTSFIVLEKVEDYVRFQIDPPKELEEACSRNALYVHTDAAQRLQQWQHLSDFDVLNGVAQAYNERIKKWNSNELIALWPAAAASADQKQVGSNSSKPAGSTAPDINMNTGGEVSEVVVTAYGLSRRSEYAMSVSTVRASDLFSAATSLDQALSGRVAGVQVINTGTPGYFSNIRIRGISSLSGNGEPLFVLDGVPLTGNVTDIINLQDIEYVEVLKNASATALYGSRGANGVINIQSKRGRSNYRYPAGVYKLKDMEDVDYLKEIKAVSRAEKLFEYKRLQVEYAGQPLFYLDMAQHFYECGLVEEAMQILTNAGEVSPDDRAVLKAMAFTLEAWGAYEEAIVLYQQILDASPSDPTASRDLAWALYQKGESQRAVNVLYAAITKSLEASESLYRGAKALLLSDMNAMIAIHKKELDLSKIDTALIRPLPADLRIVVDENVNGNYNNLVVKEPGEKTSELNGSGKSRGFILGYNYTPEPKEYILKEARDGKYVVCWQHYDYYGSTVPQMVRVTSFRNFGRPDQSIHVENVILNNQYGKMEIAEINW